MLLLRQIANRLPKAYRFKPAADLATEIEWAKNRRIGAAEYLGALAGHRPPIPEDLMEGVYAEYERRKTAAGQVDFEDLLELAIRMYDEDETADAVPSAIARSPSTSTKTSTSSSRRSSTAWLGERDELCAVGDDYQSIYGFTGATPGYLLALPERFPHAAVFRLEENYRSSPQVLALADRLVPKLGGSHKSLRDAPRRAGAGARPSGPRHRDP